MCHFVAATRLTGYSPLSIMVMSQPVVASRSAFKRTGLARLSLSLNGLATALDRFLSVQYSAPETSLALKSASVAVAVSGIVGLDTTETTLIRRFAALQTSTGATRCHGHWPHTCDAHSTSWWPVSFLPLTRHGRGSPYFYADRVIVEAAVLDRPTIEAQATGGWLSSWSSYLYHRVWDRCLIALLAEPPARRACLDRFGHCPPPGAWQGLVESLRGVLGSLAHWLGYRDVLDANGLAWLGR